MRQDSLSKGVRVRFSSNGFAFGASGTAGGLISNGIAYFLLIYYSQVVGLDPALAGFALLLALVFDAVSDPLVGRWSDRIRTRLGRRHPFLYASVLPVAVCYYCLWVPPAVSEAGLFAWLLAFTIGLRLSLTMHTVPFNALLPELAPDYDDRTRLMNYSVSAAWFFGTLISVAMYAWWLADSPEYPDGAGVLRRSGYVDAGAVAAVAVCICLAVAAAITHRHIPTLAAPPRRSPSRGRALGEIVGTLNDRNLVVLLASTVLGAVAGGTSSALWAYMQPWFWGLGSDGIRTILAAQLVAPPVALALLPRVTRGSDKKARLIQLSMLAIGVVCGPVFLDLVGAFPAAGHPLRFPLLVVFGVLQVVLSVMTGALAASMVADVVGRPRRGGRPAGGGSGHGDALLCGQGGRRRGRLDGRTGADRHRLPDRGGYRESRPGRHRAAGMVVCAAARRPVRGFYRGAALLSPWPGGPPGAPRGARPPGAEERGGWGLIGKRVCAPPRGARSSMRPSGCGLSTRVRR